MVTLLRAYLRVDALLHPVNDVLLQVREQFQLLLLTVAARSHHRIMNSFLHLTLVLEAHPVRGIFRLSEPFLLLCLVVALFYYNGLLVEQWAHAMLSLGHLAHVVRA